MYLPPAAGGRGVTPLMEWASNPLDRWSSLGLSLAIPTNRASPLRFAGEPLA